MTSLFVTRLARRLFIAGGLWAVLSVVGGGPEGLWAAGTLVMVGVAALSARDSDGTASAAACGDMPVPKDCQARCSQSNRQDTAINPDTDGERA